MTNVFEEKNVQKAIMQLGIPSMLGTLATLVYNMADTYFVSMTKDPVQIAAVTLCTPILLIVMSVSSIFGMGGSSVIARMLGEKKNDIARRCITFCTYAMAVAGVLIMILGALFMDKIAAVAGADMDNIGYTIDYLKWIFLGAPFIILSNGMLHLLRSTGLVNQATIGTVLGNGINIVLDYIFIVLMGMGTAGAALATSLGFLCSSIYYISCSVREIRKKNDLFSLSPAECRVSHSLVLDVVKIGVPGALITVMISVANIILNNNIGIYGSDAVAAYGIASKINMFPVMLSVGLTQGVAPLIGYCYGARQEDRLKKVMRSSAVDVIIVGAIFTIAFLVLSRPIASVFLHDEELIALSASFLRILCITASAVGVINLSTAYFQALGKAVSSLVITMLRNVIMFIPAIILLGNIWGLDGVISAQPATEALLTVICIMMLKAKTSEKQSEMEYKYQAQ